MNPLFGALLGKLAPLYLIILLGYIGGRVLRVQGQGTATLLIYIIQPVIVFSGIIGTVPSSSLFILPVLMLGVSCALCIFSYWVGGMLWKDSTRNILAYTAGTGNTGYFGIPVAIALFGEPSVGILIYLVFGIILYENSLGFYITSRGHFSPAESVRKVLKLPSLYAFLLAVTAQYFSVHPGEWFTDLSERFMGAYMVLGMMIIGLALGNVKRIEFDLRFIGVLFLIRFLVWPIVIGGMLWAEQRLFGVFSAEIRQVITLISVVPLAANTVALAAELNAQPEKAAYTVLLSTLFALFYIPLVSLVLFPQ